MTRIDEVIARMKERLGTACFGSGDRMDAEALLAAYEVLEAQVSQLELALRLATNERNVREVKIDEILETSHANVRSPEDYLDQARRHIEATERFKALVATKPKEQA